MLQRQESFVWTNVPAAPFEFFQKDFLLIGRDHCLKGPPAFRALRNLLPLEAWGKMIVLNDSVRAQENRPFDAVLQFPDIARQGVGP